MAFVQVAAFLEAITSNMTYLKFSKNIFHLEEKRAFSLIFIILNVTYNHKFGLLFCSNSNKLSQPKKVYKAFKNIQILNNSCTSTRKTTSIIC